MLIYSHVRARLISNYRAVSDNGLHEAGTLRGHPPIRTLVTHSLEYYVECVTLTNELRECPGLQHQWNVRKDGFPTPGNLRAWCSRHDAKGDECGALFLTIHAALRRCSNGEVVAEVDM